MVYRGTEVAVIVWFLSNTVLDCRSRNGSCGHFMVFIVLFGMVYRGKEVVDILYCLISEPLIHSPCTPHPLCPERFPSFGRYGLSRSGRCGHCVVSIGNSLGWFIAVRKLRTLFGVY